MQAAVCGQYFLEKGLAEFDSTVLWQVSEECIYTIDREATRSAFVLVSSDADQQRAIDALSSLDSSAASEEGRQIVEQLVVPGRSVLVSVITPVTVAEALRTMSSR